MSKFLAGLKNEEKPAVVSSGWAMKGNEGALRMAKRAAKQATEGGYTPEWWLRAGEAGIVRFLDEEPVVTILEHSIKRIKNGKVRYDGYTCVAGNKKTKEERQAVCPLCRADNWSPFRAIYNVIDRRVWKNKKGEEQTNQVRALKANLNLFHQLKEYAEEGGLTTRDIKIKRIESSGKGAQYTVIPKEPTSLSKEDKALKRIDIEVAYAPKSVERLAALAGVSENNDDDM